MHWTIQEIEQCCRETCGKVGIDFNIPVKINGRLTRTLGRLCYEPGWTLIPNRIEISRQMLETCSDETVREVVMHECCHYIVAIETGEPHGHDKVFKDACRRVGCRNNMSEANIFERIVSDDKVYKYQVKCKECDNILNYSRISKVIKYVNYYKCGACGGDLYVQQNW